MATAGDYLHPWGHFGSRRKFRPLPVAIDVEHSCGCQEEIHYAMTWTDAQEMALRDSAKPCRKHANKTTQGQPTERS
jgi:hypothetical protein